MQDSGTKKEPVIQPRCLTITSLALYVLIAGAPIAYMLMASVWADGRFTLQPYLDVFSDARQAGLMLRSLGIALTAAVLAVVIGTTQAFLLVRTRLPGKRIWRRLYLLPLCIPAHIHAIAWIYLCGETGAVNHWLKHLLDTTAPVLDIYTWPWAAAILALAFHPLVTLLAVSGLASMDQRLEEAARQYHRTPRVLAGVTVPLLLPHLLAGGVFVFIFAFFNYGVPSLLRVHTYPVEIFAQFSAFYNEAAATALAVPVIVVALALLAVQRRWMRGRRYAVINTGVFPAPVSALSFKQTVGATAFMALMGVVCVGLPLCLLAVQTKTLAVFSAVWRSAGREICFTTVLSLAAATGIALLAFPLAGAWRDSKSRWSAWLDFGYVVPLALPATVLGIGLIYVWNRPFIQAVYGSAGILIIAYAARFLPFSLQAVVSGLQQVGTSLREAAQLYQGVWWKRAVAVDIPLMLPALVAGWSIAFILCMSELGATLLVIPPGLNTISLKIYTLMHYGANQMVAALSLVLIAVNLLVAASAMLCVRRLNHSDRLRAAAGKAN